MLFGKFSILCFLITSVLISALWPYYQRFRSLSNIYDETFCQNKPLLPDLLKFHQRYFTGSSIQPFITFLRQWNKARKTEISYSYNINNEWEPSDEWGKCLFLTSVWIFNSAHNLLLDSTFTTTLSCVPVNS